MRFQRTFNDFLISYVGGKVAQATETSIWQGSTATNGQFGGFLPALSASAAAGGAGAVVKLSSAIWFYHFSKRID
jgi:hypothetical protein